MFSKHHYLSNRLHHSARCYTCLLDGQPVALVATLAQVGVKQMRRVTRLVVLPDYQGLGIGSQCLTEVAKCESRSHRIRIVTAHLGLIQSLKRHADWRCVRVQRITGMHRGLGRIRKKVPGHPYRAVVAFEYLPSERNAAS